MSITFTLSRAGLKVSRVNAIFNSHFSHTDKLDSSQGTGKAKAKRLLLAMLT